MRAQDCASAIASADASAASAKPKGAAEALSSPSRSIAQRRQANSPNQTEMPSAQMWQPPVVSSPMKANSESRHSRQNSDHTRAGSQDVQVKPRASRPRWL